MTPPPRLKTKVMRPIRKSPGRLTIVERRGFFPSLWLERRSRQLGRRRLPLVPLRLAEGVVDPLEGEGVGDEPVEREAVPGPLQELERARDHPRVVHDDPHDPLRAPDQAGGVELDGPSAADAADLEVRATVTEHLDPLGNDGRKADEVAGHVSAPAGRPLADLPDAGLP